MPRFNPDFDDLSAALAPTSKPRRVWTIRFGKIVRFLFIAVIAAVLTYNIPSLGDRPLGSITVNELFASLLFVGLALLCLKWMFNPIEDETAESWAAVGGGAITLGVLAAVIFSRWF